ncbi:Ras-related protein RIC1 [Camellia lanceoleosa]|nr:Ras-related protein RIC1 [Camellia lanceoleosa]
MFKGSNASDGLLKLDMAILVAVKSEDYFWKTRLLGNLAWAYLQQNNMPSSLTILLFTCRDDSYLETYMSTIGVDFKICTVEQDGKPLNSRFGILLDKNTLGQSVAVTIAVHMALL